MNAEIPMLSILIVEDEDSNIADWRDAISAHNADSENMGFRIEASYAKSVVASKRKLETHRFDAAVVDLRLQVEVGISENNSDGNDLVHHILDTQPLGVVVYSGQKNEADLTGYQCPQVQVMDRGDGMGQVFVWLAKNKDIFLRLRGTRIAFDRETAKIFYKSIWPRWSHWAEPGRENGPELTDIVARHVIAHVHDSMLHAGGGTTHPEESYFVPPLKDRVDTGDLVDLDGSVWIVVTPRCDLANDGKAESILLAHCGDISEKWRAAHGAGAKAEQKTNDLVQHERMPKQHFLLPLRDALSNPRGPWMVQFHHLKVLPAKDALEGLTQSRFASLSPMFVPSLVERFGAYFSRIGTPGLSSE